MDESRVRASERQSHQRVENWKLQLNDLLIFKVAFFRRWSFFRYLWSFQLIERSRGLQMPAIYYRYFRFRLLICSHQRNISQQFDFSVDLSQEICMKKVEQCQKTREPIEWRIKSAFFRLLHHCLRKFPPLAQLPVFSFHSLSISFQSVNHSELGKPADFENRNKTRVKTASNNQKIFNKSQSFSCS